MKENIQFNNIALGSLGENYSQIFALLSANEIEMEWFDKYDSKHYALENKLINYNKAQVKLLKENTDWRNDYIIKDIIEKYET